MLVSILLVLTLVPIGLAVSVGVIALGIRIGIRPLTRQE